MSKIIVAVEDGKIDSIYSDNTEDEIGVLDLYILERLEAWEKDRNINDKGKALLALYRKYRKRINDDEMKKVFSSPEK